MIDIANGTPATLEPVIGVITKWSRVGGAAWGLIVIFDESSNDPTSAVKVTSVSAVTDEDAVKLALSAFVSIEPTFGDDRDHPN